MVSGGIPSRTHAAVGSEEVGGERGAREPGQRQRACSLRYLPPWIPRDQLNRLLLPLGEGQLSPFPIKCVSAASWSSTTSLLPLPAELAQTPWVLLSTEVS